MLITDNASIPVSNEPDSYTSVIKAWTAALAAMNNLARGMPQVVQDRAALLAIFRGICTPTLLFMVALLLK